MNRTRERNRCGLFVGAAHTGYTILTAVCFVASAGACEAARSIGVVRSVAAGTPVVVLQVDLEDPRVKVTGMVAPRGKSDRFDSMIHRAHPTAAVTGTFFSTRSLLPVGDIVVGGQLAHRGGVGTGFCITDGNQCEFVHPPHRYKHMDWSQFDFVCCAGPRLVQGGNATVHPGAEGFRDRCLLGQASRLAVGINRHNKLLFVATRKRIQLGKMAKVMQKLGCLEAINLDAGSSLGFYQGGRYMIRPQRKLTNLILIYDDRSRYERFRARLSRVPETAPEAPSG